MEAQQAGPEIQRCRTGTADRATEDPEKEGSGMRTGLKATLAALFMAGLAVQGHAATAIPRIDIGVRAASSPQDVSLSLQILFLLTVLSLAPAILMLTTSFTRIAIVLSFLRQALGTQQIPPNQVLIGLAMFLTFFTMIPVFTL